MHSPEVVASPAVSRAVDSAQSFPETTARVSWERIRFGGWILAALVVLLYWPILQKLVTDWWDDPNYSHGFLVPVLSGYLVWQRRTQLAALTPRGSWAAGLP